MSLVQNAGRICRTFCPINRELAASRSRLRLPVVIRHHLPSLLSVVRPHAELKTHAWSRLGSPSGNSSNCTSPHARKSLRSQFSTTRHGMLHVPSGDSTARSRTTACGPVAIPAASDNSCHEALYRIRSISASIQAVVDGRRRFQTPAR
jgi:hypothetical protein